MPADMIRIMIADDNAKVRYALKVFIKLYEDLHLVGEACNVQEAIDFRLKLDPDLVLMDLIMPQMDGITAKKEISQHFPHVRVLVLTSTVDIDLIHEAISAGAKGYLLKNVTIDMMANTIRSAVL